MIAASYTVDRAEYIEAQRLFQRQRGKRARVWHRSFLIILFAAMFVLLWRIDSVFVALLVTAIAAIISIGIGLLAKLILQSFLFRHRFKTDARLLTDVNISLDENGFVSRSTGIGHGTMEWSAFNSWTEGPTVFVLFVGYLFRPIPKRALNDAESHELRNLLESKIGPKDTVRKL